MASEEEIDTIMQGYAKAIFLAVTHDGVIHRRLKGDLIDGIGLANAAEAMYRIRLVNVLSDTEQPVTQETNVHEG